MIKWIEDKTEDYRGNLVVKAFKFNNSEFTFQCNACMTYKTFKSMVRRMAQHYGAKVVTVCEPWQGTDQEFVDSPNWIIVNDMNGYTTEEKPQLYKFYKELVVPEGEKRKKKYIDEKVIFPHIK